MQPQDSSASIEMMERSHAQDSTLEVAQDSTLEVHPESFMDTFTLSDMGPDMIEDDDFWDHTLRAQRRANLQAQLATIAEENRIPTDTNCFGCVRTGWAGVLVPHSTIVRWWERVMLFLLVYTVVVMPLRLAFSEGLSYWELPVDALFLTDMVLTFFLAYELPDGSLCTSHWAIAKRYLTSWFVVDLLASFPWWALAIGRENSDSTQWLLMLRLPKAMRVLRLVRLLKLLRLYRMSNLGVDLEFGVSSGRISRSCLRILRLLVFVLVFVHFTGCLWYYIGSMALDSEGDEVDGQGDTWILQQSAIEALHEQHATLQYLVSLYWALTTLTTIGYGDITPQRTVEIVYAIIMMLVGATLFSYITATFSSIVRNSDSQANAVRTKMTRLVRFMVKNKISEALQAQVREEMALYWRHKRPSSKWAAVKHDLPPHIVRRLALELYEDVVDESPLLRLFKYDSKHKGFLMSLVSRLTAVSVPVGRSVGVRGEQIDRIFIIRRGRVNAAHLENDDSGDGDDVAGRQRTRWRRRKKKKKKRSSEEDIVLKQFKPGELVGLSVVCHTPLFPCDFVVAGATPAHLLCISAEDLLSLLARFPATSLEVERYARREFELLRRIQEFELQQAAARKQFLIKGVPAESTDDETSTEDAGLESRAPEGDSHIGSLIRRIQAHHGERDDEEREDGAELALHTQGHSYPNFLHSGKLASVLQRSISEAHVLSSGTERPLRMRSLPSTPGGSHPRGPSAVMPPHQSDQARILSVMLRVEERLKRLEERQADVREQLDSLTQLQHDAAHSD